MDKRTLTRLSYHTILEQLAGCSVSSLGRERAQGLLPITDLETIKHWQAETTQGRDLLRLEPLAEVGGWQDIRQQVMQAGHGLVLEPGDLLSVARTLTASRRVRKFLLDRQEQYPLLYDIGIVLGQFDDIEQKIYDAIGPNGEVSDQASPELARINRSLANLQAQIKSKLDQFIRSQTCLLYTSRCV